MCNVYLMFIPTIWIHLLYIGRKELCSMSDKWTQIVGMLWSVAKLFSCLGFLANLL